MARKFKYSKSEDHKGKKVPITDFIGVYCAHTTKDGTPRWRAHVWFSPYGDDRKELRVIGYYDTDLEAARAYDDYVRKNNITASVNFDDKGNRLKSSHLTEPQERLVLALCRYVPSKKIAKILGVSTKLINSFMKANSLKAVRGEVLTVFIDKRDMYEVYKAGDV